MTLTAGLDLGDALRATAALGHAHVEGAIVAPSADALWREVAAGPLRAFEGSFGPVRQEIEGFDVRDPMDAFPRIAELRDELASAIRRDGAGVRGLATWWPNEAGIAVYRPGSLGITPHLDGKWYRRLVAVVTVHGWAPFTVCRDRGGEVVDRWVAGPGGVTFLRGPGLAGRRDGRPFHTVVGPERGRRCSIGLRMDTRPTGGDGGSAAPTGGST